MRFEDRVLKRFFGRQETFVPGEVDESLVAALRIKGLLPAPKYDCEKIVGPVADGSVHHPVGWPIGSWFGPFMRIMCDSDEWYIKHIMEEYLCKLNLEGYLPQVYRQALRDREMECRRRNRMRSVTGSSR